MLMIPISLLVLWTLFVRINRAQNITASTCASPDGFQQCSASADDFFSTCLAQFSGDANGKSACICTYSLKNINCALSNCWNVVYGCEYQSMVSDWFTNCPAAQDLSDIPFWPAPDNAPGGCSCNIGYVTQNVTVAQLNVIACINKVSGADDGIPTCNCCAQAGVYTSLLDICPGVDPTLIGYNQIQLSLVNYDPQFSNCGQYLDTDGATGCVQNLGFPSIGSTYVTALPSTDNTGTYSTTEGSITTPLRGTSFVWSATGSENTIIANGLDSGSSGSEPGSGSGQASSTSGGQSGSSGGASQTSPASGSATGKPNAGVRRNVTLNQSLLIAMAFAMTILM